jgi:hypothetical protein
MHARVLFISASTTKFSINANKQSSTPALREENPPAVCRYSASANRIASSSFCRVVQIIVAV